MSNKPNHRNEQIFRDWVPEWLRAVFDWTIWTYECGDKASLSCFTPFRQIFMRAK